jgi:hypothetical protein
MVLHRPVELAALTGEVGISTRRLQNRRAVSLNNKIMDATIRAVVEHTEGLRLKVDFDNEQTALIH